ncbi:MAG: hypothetical protein HQM08_07390 [Candidatus Riflebacteria bacterium]|nr:hypothetical protein [Candidatus Riflebacteria bacterium]
MKKMKTNKGKRTTLFLLFLLFFNFPGAWCDNDLKVPPPLKPDGTSYSEVPASLSYQLLLSKMATQSFPVSCIKTDLATIATFCWGPCREEYYKEASKRGMPVSIASVSIMDNLTLSKGLEKFRQSGEKAPDERVISFQSLSRLVQVASNSIILIDIRKKNERSSPGIPGAFFFEDYSEIMKKITLASGPITVGNNPKDLLVIMFGANASAPFPLNEKREFEAFGFESILFFKDGAEVWNKDSQL